MGGPMIRALGFSQTDFDPARPGRLCRGRERWIEPFQIDSPGEIHRLVITGSIFTDDSARDALRGLNHSEVDLSAVVAAIFPRKELLAFMEDGHPADIPEDAEHVEAYTGYRAGGLRQEALVRWVVRCEAGEDVERLIGDDPQADRVRGFAILDEDTDLDALRRVLFLFVGMSTLDSPPARYQPSALPDVLEHVPAVVVLHRDKHGPAVGMYAREERDVDTPMKALAEREDVLLVPFAIPPMLARWDRALYELRQIWDPETMGEYPVPESDDPSTWARRRRRKKKKRKKKGDDSGEE